MAAISLLAFDLDGTLLDSTKRIRPEARSALLQLQSEGMFVTFITGRSFAGTERYATELQIQIPFGLIHGALVLDLHGLRIQNRVIPAPGVREGLELAVKFECLPVLITAEEPDALTFCEEHRDHPIARMPLAQIQETETASQEVRFRPLEEIDGSAYTLYLIGKKEKVQALLEEHRAIPVQISEATQVPVHGFEAEKAFRDSHSVAMFTPKGASKRTALEAIADTLGIDLSEVAAFGDWHNDLPMLEAAGHAVIMGNAPPELVRNVRNPRLIRTGPNDGTGIVDALAKLGLL